MGVYTIPVKGENFHKAIITAANCLLKLTGFEIDIVCAILDSDIEYLTPQTRAYIREYLNTDVYTLNNYIKRLKDKNALVTNSEGNLEVNPSILEMIKDKKLEIRFNVIEVGAEV